MSLFFRLSLTRPVRYSGAQQQPLVFQCVHNDCVCPLQDNDRVWIVTELCSGGDLEHFMKVLTARLNSTAAPIVT